MAQRFKCKKQNKKQLYKNSKTIPSLKASLLPTATLPPQPLQQHTELGPLHALWSPPAGPPQQPGASSSLPLQCHLAAQSSI